MSNNELDNIITLNDEDGNAVDFQAVFSLNLSPMYDGPETGDEIVGPFMGTVSGKGEKI